MRSGLRLALACALAGCSGGAAVEETDTAPHIRPTGNPTAIVTIHNVANAKCIAVPHGARGTVQLQQWACTRSNDAQAFRATAYTDGSYTFRNIASNACLEVADATMGTRLQQGVCNGASKQRWKATELDDGVYSLASVETAACIDVPNAATANGTLLQQWSCYENDAQGFSFSVVSGRFPLTQGSAAVAAAPTDPRSHT